MPHEGGVDRADGVIRVAAAMDSIAADEVATAAGEDDAVTVLRTGPTGIDRYEPLVMATIDGETAFHASVDAPEAIEIASMAARGELRHETAVAVATHGADRRGLPQPDRGPLSVGERRVLTHCGWMPPLDGDRREIVAERGSTPEVSGLEGRGRGDAAPDVSDTWARVRDTEGEPVVVVNANDAYREQRADRLLLESDPISVIDGAAMACQATGASEAVFYLNEGDEWLHGHLERAIEAVSERLSVSLQIVGGPDRYLAGEPTPALESLEGADRLEPRLQPPTPAEYGLFGRPTAVHTPRTLAQVRAMAANESVGVADGGTRLFSVFGDVVSKAVVEIGSETELAALTDAVELRGEFKFAVVGGMFGGITERLDVATTSEAMVDAGLGLDGVVELCSDERCVLATVGDRARFASEKNAGRCVPGREGTAQLTTMLREVYDGEFEPEMVRELGRVMRRSANCEIGRDAARPALTGIEQFEHEFRAHADGRCVAGSCGRE